VTALILGLIGFGSASAGIPAERQMTITLAELQGELRDGFMKEAAGATRATATSVP
jgi:hypothetical protein